MELKHTEVKFVTADSEWQRVYDAAEKTEKNNIVSWENRKLLVEGGGDYSDGIWLETQPMGGEMYGSRNLELALNNQLLFMENIREDGRLPSVIRYTGSEYNLMYSHFQGYCFPYHALNVYYLIGENREYLKLLYGSLSRFDDYLWRTRDTDGNGCLESFCKWDTGEDRSVRFFDGPDAWGSDEPPYGQAKLPYESMDIMSYSYDGKMTLAEISDILGNGEGDKWRVEAQAVRAKLNSYLWWEEKGALYDRDCNNEFLDTLIHNNLRVMYHGAYEKSKADRFVTEHLLNPDEFFTPMPLPSIAANDPLFFPDPSNNWSGQPEGLTYQRAIRALENYGYHNLIPVFGHKLCHALAMNDPVMFTQQFDHLTGKPQTELCTISGDYGPSILAILGYTAHMYGVEMRRKKLIFSTLGDCGGCEYSQIYGDSIYTVKNDGKKAALYINKKEIASVPCGTKVICDFNGNIEQSFSVSDKD